MMVADKMSNRPIRPNRLIGPIRLIVPIYPKNKKKCDPEESHFCSLVRQPKLYNEEVALLVNAD